MNSAIEIIAEVNKLANLVRANSSMRYFKTEFGQYGYGDKFIGITNPQIHQIVKDSREVPLQEITPLLQNDIHEIRLLGFLMLVDRYKRAKDSKTKNIIYDVYMTNIDFVNNWDIVDITAPKIIGSHLATNPKKIQILTSLARSNSLWYRRIAILSTFHDISTGSSDCAFAIISILKNDSQDLIQKAVGWCLREIGKNIDEKVLIHYLDENHRNLPRTTLRYAIERLPEQIRKSYLKK